MAMSTNVCWIEDSKMFFASFLFLLNSFTCITCWSKTWSSRWLQLGAIGCARACFGLGKGGGLEIGAN